MRAGGWVLVALMFLYPLEGAQIVFWTPEILEPAAVHVQDTQTGGMQFDLGRMHIHCSLLGWLGQVACVVGIVWVLGACALRLLAWHRGSKWDGPSCVALLAVGGSVAMVLATHYAFWRAFGINLG